MKIAYIFNRSYFFGGGEISLRELIKYVPKKKYKPLIVVPGSGEIEKVMQDMGLPVFICQFPPLRSLFAFGPLITLLRLCSFLRKNHVDLIHANGSRCCLYSNIAGKIIGVPVIWHVRETKQDLYFYDKLLGMLAAKIICVSKSVRVKRFKRYNAHYNRKFAVIYNGVDTINLRRDDGKRAVYRAELGLKKEEILFGLVGNLIRRKGQAFFLKSLTVALRSETSLPCKVLLIGHADDADYYSELKAFVRYHKIEDKVIFKSFEKDINKIFSGIDVLVLPSQSEGFSRSIIEAMSFGLPILASDIAEIKEAVTPDINGILTEYKNIDAMSVAILKFVHQSYALSEMRDRNRQKAVKSFDIRGHTANVEKIYQELQPTK